VTVNQRHHAKRSRKSLLSFGAAALLAMTAATAQVAGTPAGTTGIDASGDYRSEVQSCLSGRTQQDRDTCLREARNARADKQKGQLDAAARSQFQANAMQRCEPFKGEERAACEARVMGYGNTSGSVAEGGLLRQVETVVMPPGVSEITVEPKTENPVVLVPKQQ
jgi:hypothetical protein